MIPPWHLSFPVLSLTYPSELRHPGYGVTVPITTHVGLCVTSPDQQTLNFCSKVKSFPKHGGTKESFTERHISEKDETLRWGRWSHNDRWKIWSKGGLGQATAETQPAPDFCIKKNDKMNRCSGYSSRKQLNSWTTIIKHLECEKKIQRIAYLMAHWFVLLAFTNRVECYKAEIRGGNDW